MADPTTITISVETIRQVALSIALLLVSFFTWVVRKVFTHNRRITRLEENDEARDKQREEDRETTKEYREELRTALSSHNDGVIGELKEMRIEFRETVVEIRQETTDATDKVNKRVDKILSDRAADNRK